MLILLNNDFHIIKKISFIKLKKIKIINACKKLIETIFEKTVLDIIRRFIFLKVFFISGLKVTFDYKIIKKYSI